VHLDGRAVKACTVLAIQADGAVVDTIESLSNTGDGEHPLLAAFREHHALQCGFCTPGMIMNSQALLQREPRPSEERIRTWLKGNFCRCTGYQHIVDAIRAVSETSATPGEAEAVTPPPPSLDTSVDGRAAPGGAAAQDVRFVGQPIPRREDDRHLRGRGHFTDDVRSTDTAGTLYAAVVRSPHAHARIRSVSVDQARKMPGVVAVVTGADLLDSVSLLPTNWVMPGMQVPVHRVLAEEVVRFQGEGVAAVVAVDAYTAADAMEAVDVDYEPLHRHARFLAGGHALLPASKLRHTRPSTLIDLGRIAELRGIEVVDDAGTPHEGGDRGAGGLVRVGAMTTSAEIEYSPGIALTVPLLPKAAAVISDPLIRNRATLGGSLAEADPRGDWPPVVLATDATMYLRSRDVNEPCRLATSSPGTGPCRARDPP
jgi:hypothetical protein